MSVLEAIVINSDDACVKRRSLYDDRKSMMTSRVLGEDTLLDKVIVGSEDGQTGYYDIRTIIAAARDGDTSTTLPPRVREETQKLLSLMEDDLSCIHQNEHYTWAEALDNDERQQMRMELADALVHAVETDDWSTYDNAWSDWRATADVLSDPELVASLTVALKEQRNPPKAVSPDYSNTK